MVRDYDYWADELVHAKVEEMLQIKWRELKDDARRKRSQKPKKPTQTGLCVSIYKAKLTGKIGESVDNQLYSLCVIGSITQLGIAAIPCGIFGDWGILMITACGIALSSVTASLPQRRSEKWYCRRLPKNSRKNLVLTRGNGSQHAIAIVAPISVRASGCRDLRILTVFCLPRSSEEIHQHPTHERLVYTGPA
ncbi:hypothetical protein N7488_009133 [Penicillium malachiteum]|nr:hypothetical protein N7488_009133 [Penicillium malachiteum]